jgi:hypothetical protein
MANKIKEKQLVYLNICKGNKEFYKEDTAATIFHINLLSFGCSCWLQPQMENLINREDMASAQPKG